MKKQITSNKLIAILGITAVLASFAFKDEITDKFNDGPYTFIIGDNNGLSKSIVAGEVVEQEVALDKVQFEPEQTYFKNVKRIAALSDIHGQNDVFIHLLKSNKIIDEAHNWNYGDGHLVITGDIFDRGDQVTEALWLVYKLEQQAEEVGGKVHYLLGNHEYMVLHDDMRYVHEKYVKTSELLQSKYKDLFSNETVLGRWIRSKSTIIKINDNVFLHGGLSQVFLDRDIPLEKANRMYRKTIDMTKPDIRASETYAPFHSSDSPIWYRGYFSDELTDSDIDKILVKAKASRIIVGHTSQTEVVKKYDGKIFAIDTSIKKGESGQLLFIEDGEFYRGTYDGEKSKL